MRPCTGSTARAGRPVRVCERMSTDQGWEKWYWRDWLADPDVQALPACGRCGWFELLGWMWLNETDRWEGSRHALKRLLRMDQGEFDMFIEDMVETDVATVTYEKPSGSESYSNETIMLMSRRRHRDVERNDRSRQSNRLRQQRFRRKQVSNAPVTPLLSENNATESESERDPESDRYITPSVSTSPSDQDLPDHGTGGHALQPPPALERGGDQGGGEVDRFPQCQIWGSVLGAAPGWHGYQDGRAGDGAAQARLHANADPAGDGTPLAPLARKHGDVQEPPPIHCLAAVEFRQLSRGVGLW